MQNIKETTAYSVAMAIRPFIATEKQSHVDEIVENIAYSIKSHARKEAQPLVDELNRLKDTFMNLKLEGREWAQLKIDRIDEVLKKATE